jgi:hypothetical protein
VKPDTADALSLLSAEAVRRRAHRLLAIGLEDQLPHFRVDLSLLGKTADFVVETMRRAYPTLDVPLHARWRHFTHHGRDRWAEIARGIRWRDAAERARAAFDLAIVSVLLDGGAGPRWSYRDAPTGTQFGRSEGLALASLAMFAEGAFSSERGSPLRADATALRTVTREELARHFQVSSANPLAGVDGRADLLRRLGATVATKPEIFARAGAARPGGLFDHLAAIAERGSIGAPVILREVLHHLGPIWPSRLELGGIALGDCWRHPAMITGDATNGLVPLHKLSQWLAYSLIEPLQAAGIEVANMNGLTGLAEYRNGGLFLDTGVLALRDANEANREHDVGTPLVVEWRALTIALLDRLADDVRQRLRADAESLPLARILQGGTWAAGRAIARKRRSNGEPPIKVGSDSTVF